MMRFYVKTTLCCLLAFLVATTGMKRLFGGPWGWILPPPFLEAHLDWESRKETGSEEEVWPPCMGVILFWLTLASWLSLIPPVAHLHRGLWAMVPERWCNCLFKEALGLRILLCKVRLLARNLQNCGSFWKAYVGPWLEKADSLLWPLGSMSLGSISHELFSKWVSLRLQARGSLQMWTGWLRSTLLRVRREPWLQWRCTDTEPSSAPPGPKRTVRGNLKDPSGTSGCPANLCTLGGILGCSTSLDSSTKTAASLS